MPKSNHRSRNLKPNEIQLIAEWIMETPDTPSWDDVRKHVIRTYNVNRSVESLRRNADLKIARDARQAEPPKRRPTGPRPTRRKLETLEDQVARLKSEVARLEGENHVLFERNLRLINGARIRNITEEQLERAFVPVNRNPTRLPSGGTNQ
jgi:predicted RNase H-like nuclease (RuvC/YqgF family)